MLLLMYSNTLACYWLVLLSVHSKIFIPNTFFRLCSHFTHMHMHTHAHRHVHTHTCIHTPLLSWFQHCDYSHLHFLNFDNSQWGSFAYQWHDQKLHVTHNVPGDELPLEQLPYKFPFTVQREMHMKHAMLELKLKWQLIHMEYCTFLDHCGLFLVGKLCLTLLWPHALQPTKFLCPWDSPGKNTGVGCHFFLQGIFPTQG